MIYDASTGTVLSHLFLYKTIHFQVKRELGRMKLEVGLLGLNLVDFYGC